jgi:hypothetical protein
MDDHKTKVVPLFTGAQKAQRIEEALELLRGAEVIDERDTVPVEELVAWYDRVLPTVTSIEQLVGAMKIELHRRRGAAVLREGERRGSAKGNQHSGKLTTEVSLPPREWKTRSQDRLLAKAPAAVEDYLTATITAGGVPTVTGAVRAAARTKPSRRGAKAPARCVKPATACATCATTSWRRTKRGGVWYCEECRRRNVTKAAQATQQRRLDAREAALQAKRATLPRWQQAIYRGDAQDVLIWRLFTLERIAMEHYAKGGAASLDVQGRTWVIRAHLDQEISERARLFSVFQSYGAMLAHKENVGDPTRPPWWETGKSPFTRR